MEYKTTGQKHEYLIPYQVCLYVISIMLMRYGICFLFSPPHGRINEECGIIDLGSLLLI